MKEERSRVSGFTNTILNDPYCYHSHLLYTPCMTSSGCFSCCSTTLKIYHFDNFTFAHSHESFGHRTRSFANSILSFHHFTPGKKSRKGHRDSKAHLGTPQSKLSSQTVSVLADHHEYHELQPPLRYTSPAASHQSVPAEHMVSNSPYVRHVSFAPSAVNQTRESVLKTQPPSNSPPATPPAGLFHRLFGPLRLLPYQSMIQC